MRIEPVVEGALIALLRQKPVSRIHVSDLIEQSGICKGTFYKYYCDKYDLLQKCFRHLCYDRALENETLESFLMQLLHDFRKNAKAVLNAMPEGDVNSLFQYNSELVYGYLVKDRAAAGMPVEGEDIEYAMRFYSRAVTRIVADWLADPRLAPPEKLMETVRGMMPCLLAGPCGGAGEGENVRQIA